ncbi:hypothetical protein SAMN04489832_6025 [Micromonospora cremea]|uniref:Uncharacterized protein n=2 Tax=Micromonospora cremea TaxID=709881 RepID=A0A1N6AS04_9ACTN|nr:hypothetical protein SAMN04489832_6025 [Micromonospora cremea]
MALDKETAARMAEERLAEWRRLSYGEWRVMLEDRELRQVVGEDGKRYSVACHGLDDGEGRVRMVVAVDDGGWPAFVPQVRVEIMNPDGTFLD